MCSRHGLLKQASVMHRAQLRDERVSDFRQLFNPLLEQEAEAIRSTLEAGESLETLVEGFYAEHRGRVVEEATPLVRDYGSEVASAALDEMESEASVDESGFVEPYTEGLAGRWTGESIAQVRRLEQDAEDRDELRETTEERLTKWDEERAEWTSEREATQAGGGFAKHAFLLAGASALIWRAVGESCPLCSRMNGERVGITGSFLTEGDEIEADGEDGPKRLRVDKSIGHPPLHGMGGGGGVCDCVVTGVM